MLDYLVFKRVFDVVFSIILLLLLLPIILISVVIASIETNSYGVFKQKRLGLNQIEFTVYKVKTMRDDENESSQMSVLNKTRITTMGSYMRKFKIDEFLQLYNILLGDMSFVGPRPDTHEMLLELSRVERLEVYSVRPGLTSLASLAFINEEFLLKQCENPIWYHDNILLPMKIKLNLDYVRLVSFKLDFQILLKTFFKMLTLK